jgi:hypothetical protein
MPLYAAECPLKSSREHKKKKKKKKERQKMRKRFLSASDRDVLNLGQLLNAAPGARC